MFAGLQRMNRVIRVMKTPRIGLTKRKVHSKADIDCPVSSISLMIIKQISIKAIPVNNVSQRRRV